MPEANVDLLIGGTSIRSVTGLYVASWDGLLATAPYRGSNRRIPGLPGSIGTVKVPDEFGFELPVTLAASSKSGQIAILNAFHALWTNNLATLTRVLPTNTSGATASTTCNGEYVSAVALSAINFHTARTTLGFVNLDGSWA